jgi:hypothetical protein
MKVAPEENTDDSVPEQSQFYLDSASHKCPVNEFFKITRIKIPK